MAKGIAKVVGGIVAIGVAVFAAIAAAGLAGDGLEEVTSGPTTTGTTEALRKAS